MNARTYYRLSPAIWHESWSDDIRYLAFYVLTCEHRTTEGLFRMPLAYAREDLNWPAKRFMAAWDALIDAGFIEYDDVTAVCLIVKALTYQSPANPNQVKGAAKKIAQLPATPLLERFLTLADSHAKPLAELLRERLAQPLKATVGNTPSSTSVSSTQTPPSPPKGGLRPTPPEGKRKADHAKFIAAMASWAPHNGIAPAEAVEDAIASLRQTVGDATFDVWLEGLHVHGTAAGGLVLAAPARMTGWIVDRFSEQVAAAFVGIPIDLHPVPCDHVTQELAA